jgi:hypothetical protein
MIAKFARSFGWLKGHVHAEGGDCHPNNASQSPPNFNPLIISVQCLVAFKCLKKSCPSTQYLILAPYTRGVYLFKFLAKTLETYLSLLGFHNYHDISSSKYNNHKQLTFPFIIAIHLLLIVSHS